MPNIPRFLSEQTLDTTGHMALIYAEAANQNRCLPARFKWTKAAARQLLLRAIIRARWHG
jgi:hypothetical protein